MKISAKLVKVWLERKSESERQMMIFDLYNPQPSLSSNGCRLGNQNVMMGGI